MTPLQNFLRTATFWSEEKSANFLSNQTLFNQRKVLFHSTLSYVSAQVTNLCSFLPQQTGKDDEVDESINKLIILRTKNFTLVVQSGRVKTM